MARRPTPSTTPRVSEAAARRPPVAVVAVGGAVGRLLRWCADRGVPGPGRRRSRGRPSRSTCRAAWLLAAAAGARRRAPAAAVLPPLLGTGVLGGFTTLSTYSEQARALLASGHAGDGRGLRRRHARGLPGWPSRSPTGSARRPRAPSSSARRATCDLAARRARRRGRRAAAVRRRAPARRPAPPGHHPGELGRARCCSAGSAGSGSPGDALALLGTGFCGGLTTYSSFAVQTHDRGRGWHGSPERRWSRSCRRWLLCGARLLASAVRRSRARAAGRRRCRSGGRSRARR